MIIGAARPPPFNNSNDMAKKRTEENQGNIEQLKFDDKNFNKHTEYGMGLLEKSLRENGAGRSVLVDKDDNIIAGNGIVEAAQKAGIVKTRIVEVTGDELVVVKRTDIELDSKKGRRMALADNATAAADLFWDEERIAAETDKWEIVPEDWGVNINVPSPDGFGDKFSLPDGEKGIAQMAFTLANEQVELIHAALDMAKGEVDEAEMFGNKNSNGNALYKIVKEWVEQRK